MGDQGRPAAPASPPRSARAGGRAKIEPMLARTAFGENGSAQSGPSATGPSSSACGGADDRADVAGVADPVQVEAGRRRRRRPSAAARPRSPASPSRAPRPRPAAPARPPRRPSAGSPAPRLEQEARLGAGGQPGLDQVLALGREQPLALAVLALAQLADQLQLLVLGAGDHRVGLSVFWFGGFFSWNTKKRAVFTARPGRVECRCAARRPHPPGLARQIGGRRRGR